jgi:prevent-host-death family protein
LENLKMTTQRTISASELRDQLRTVINEVYYGQAEYLVVKFGQTAAVIISPADFQLLQQARQQLDQTRPPPAQGQAPRY